MSDNCIRTWVVMVAMCITLASSPALAKQVRTVTTIEGWTIKSRANADGKFLACSMERSFLANKGDGRFRLNIIAWPESVIVLLRGNDGFLGGKGIGRFEIVSNHGPLFSGRIRFDNSEVLFALNGRESRRHVATSKGWSISKDGNRVARFPMSGAGAAMEAVEKCGKLPSETAQSVVAEGSAVDADVISAPALPSGSIATQVVPDTTQPGGPALADSRELKMIMKEFSQGIGRPDFKVTGFDSGVLQWSYSDAITSGAALVTQQAKTAARYAAGLSIRPDQCADSVLTLPLTVRPVSGGEHAAVVSMCRGKDSVKVRHVHVVRRGGGLTYVLNYETEAEPDGTGMPQRSDELARAFASAVMATVEG